MKRWLLFGMCIGLTSMLAFAGIASHYEWLTLAFHASQEFKEPKLVTSLCQEQANPRFCFEMCKTMPEACATMWLEKYWKAHHERVESIKKEEYRKHLWRERRKDIEEL